MLNNAVAMSVFGLTGVAALGAWHLAGLLLLKRIKPSKPKQDYLAVLTTFWGLLLLHASEIGWCAAMLAIALVFSDASLIVDGYGDSVAGLIYLGGVSFTTFGFTSQAVDGPLRLLLMIQSLGGFMILTWFATFVYSIWEERFR